MSTSDAKEVLPDWVAADATGIHLLQRTTGDERILTFQSQSGLPPSCVPVKTAGKPTDDELVAGLSAENKRKKTELQEQVQQQVRTPQLEAVWWPTGTEAKTTHLCGKWWVPTSAAQIYGYTPETKTVADGIKQERDAKTKEE